MTTSDVLIVGYGWAGSMMAYDLVSRGLRVVVLERGSDLPNHPSCGHFHGPQGRRPQSRTQDAARETFTLRHHQGEQALPIRRMGSFLSGAGVGGGGVLWGGLSPRYSPESFRPAALFDESIGRDAELDIRDWPIDYDDLSDGYSRFENLVGVAGSDGQPVGPAPTNEGPDLFRAAAESKNLTVASLPTSEIDIAYTNPLGVSREPCEEFGTTLATPLNTVDPYSRATGQLTVITGAHVRRVEHDGRHVTGVTYFRGGAEHTATASSYVLAAWTLNNVRLLMLSNIGAAYDPATGAGTLGRSLSNHLTLGGTAFFDSRTIDSSRKTGGGWVTSDFENAGTCGRFAGGAQMHSSNLELKPKPEAVVPHGTSRWGAKWKDALREYRDSMVRINITGEVVPRRTRYLDLDTVYRDAWGDPLLRLTYDWSPNERALADAMASAASGILEATGADRLHVPHELSEQYSVAAYQNSHLAGGAVMGADPHDSVVDTDLRSWHLDNLWVVGASAFPRNAAPNPTATLVALALRASASVASVLTTESTTKEGRPE
ncbi:FAD-dependent oxidoreductase [Nocardia jiangxiensis]|uniref:FAD-dependent oxidoreductase n=1 Tax=Nocardia jiangxiensis TaxID=282685 RepID=A0ABW6S8E3_9NOCA